MTDHLPECTYSPGQPGFGGIDSGISSTQPYLPPLPCICPALRACEQRVLDDDVLAASYHGQKGYEVGYRKGLDVARKAVAALDACPECSVDAALAAIDALLEDQA